MTDIPSLCDAELPLRTSPDDSIVDVTLDGVICSHSHSNFGMQAMAHAAEVLHVLGSPFSLGPIAEGIRDLTTLGSPSDGKL